MVLGTQWIKSEVAEKFVSGNSPVAKWLAEFDSIATKGNYGRVLYHFCKWSGKSPAQLLEEEKLAKAGGSDTEFNVLDNWVHKFLLEGVINDDSIRGRGRQIKIAETSKANRQLIYAAIRSFFLYNRHPLPRDPKFKIKEKSRTKGTQEPVSVEDARKIISATKDPYRTLFEVAIFAGMGQGELVLLNELWPQILERVKKGEDPIRVGFTHRKRNEKEYYTFIPLRLLKPFADVATTPFKTTRGTPVSGPDLETSWKFAKKRAGVKGKIRIHDCRDLFRTLSWRVGIKPESANFLMGHSISDEQGYLRIFGEPFNLIEEWGKLRSYLEIGVTTEVTEKIRGELGEGLRDRDEKILRLENRLVRLEARDEQQQRAQAVLDRLTPEQEKRFWEFVEGLKEKAKTV